MPNFPTIRTDCPLHPPTPAHHQRAVVFDGTTLLHVESGDDVATWARNPHRISRVMGYTGAAIIEFIRAYMLEHIGCALLDTDGVFTGEDDE